MKTFRAGFTVGSEKEENKKIPFPRERERDSECSVSCPKGLLYDAHVYGIQAFFALLNLKLYAVSIADGLHEAGSVNEDVLAPAVGCDEAKSFGFIEKFYDTGAHNK